jgi:hypothetical protein
LLSTDGTAEADTEKFVDGYAGNWPVFSYITFVTVPRDWRLTVRARGLAHVDEYLILKAGDWRSAGGGAGQFAPIVYLHKGGGSKVAAKSGFVARDNGTGQQTFCESEIEAVRTINGWHAEMEAENARQEAVAEARRIEEASARGRAAAQPKKPRLGRSREDRETPRIG